VCTNLHIHCTTALHPWRPLLLLLLLRWMASNTNSALDTLEAQGSAALEEEGLLGDPEGAAAEGAAPARPLGILGLFGQVLGFQVRWTSCLCLCFDNSAVLCMQTARQQRDAVLVAWMHAGWLAGWLNVFSF
jgi:hypothetical protein